MLPTLNRHVLMISLAVFSTLACADNPHSKPNPNEPSVFLKSLDSSGDPLIPPHNLGTTQPIKTTSQQSPTQLEQLENTQAQLQNALNNLEQQSNQLQANLSVLTQQLGEISPTHKTPEETQQLEQLRKEHQQIQDGLTALFQQQQLLQARTFALNNQITQLRETLTAPKFGTAPTANLAVAPTTSVDVNTSTAITKPETPASLVTPPAPPLKNATISSTPAVQTTSSTAPITPKTPSITTPPATPASTTTPITPNTITAKPENGATLTTPAPLVTPPAPPLKTGAPATQTTSSASPTAPITPKTPASTTTPITPNTISNTPIPKAATNVTASAQKVLPPQHLTVKKGASTASWTKNPTMMLRVGGGFIALALLLLLFLFWPRKKQPKAIAPKTVTREVVHPQKETEDADLAPEYDFLNTDEAIPTRLNLVRGYLEMHKYTEAREAISSIIERGNTLQKKEATDLLREIEKAENTQISSIEKA